MRQDIRRSPALTTLAGTKEEATPTANPPDDADRVVFVLGRREFCRLALGCAAAAVAVGCMSGDPALGTGPIPEGSGEGGDDDASVAPTVDARRTPDARPGQPDAHGAPDAAPPPPDAGVASTCSTAYQSVGAPSTFSTGTAVFFRSMNLFVMRDSGGLYAISSVCTHQGATVQQKSSEFYCPRHGATFDLNGNVKGGPVSRGLAHYAMCMMSNGMVGVNPGATTSQGARLVV